MVRMLGIGPATRAAGVSRREIQMRIADGDLESFEGRVDCEALARLYPRAATLAPGMVEYVAGLREAALAKPPSSTETSGSEAPAGAIGAAVGEVRAHEPSRADKQPGESAGSEVGADTVERLTRQRDHARALARDRLLLLFDLERRLGQLEVDVKPPQRVRALVQWLKARLRRDVR